MEKNKYVLKMNIYRNTSYLEFELRQKLDSE